MDTYAERIALLNAWKTNARVTAFLVEHLSAALWEARVPEAPRRTGRALASHIHNVRCRWIKMLGEEHGLEVPIQVDRHRIDRSDLLRALATSETGVQCLLGLGFDRGGVIPLSAGYVWRNLPLDVGHVLTYLVAHEAHHRGQIAMLARQVGQRLPAAVTNGLWQWSTRATEAGVTIKSTRQ